MHNIVLAHRILVSLFLLQYLVKLVLLLAGKKEQLASYTKATRIAEMLVSVGFLVTGVWMLVYLPNVSVLMIVKLVCVFASIPLAVIGFKKGNKALAALAVVLILAAYGLAEVNKKQAAGGKIDTSSAKDNLTIGTEVYQSKCVACHGADGKLGVSGAKDLSVTTLTIDEQKAIIKNGKSPMPGYKDNLTDDQLQAVVEYIGTLKKAN